jgi:PAS domain S-box-containing protein
LETGEAYELDLEMLVPDGTTKWLVAHGEVIRNIQGHVENFRGTVKDITERKRSEEARRRSEGYLSQAEQLAHIGSWAWDARTRELFWSQELFRIFGDDPTKTKPSLPHFLARVHPEDRSRAERAINDEASGLEVVADYRIVLPDGTIKHIRSISQPVKNRLGEVVEVVGTTVDITERKLAEEALSTVSRKLIEAQEQERSRIARELHDDINQRLGLLGSALGRLEHDLPVTEIELGQRLGQASQMIKDLSNDVQDLSRQLHSPKLELLGLASAAAGFCRELSDQKGVEIDFYSENVPNELTLEVSLPLYRVLQEALQNSIKHSGSRTIQVSLKGEANEIELAVHDSGVGFEYEEAIKGRGLGLTSMIERLKIANGRLSIDSDPQRGTTLRARVPLGPTGRSAAASG